MPQLYFRYSTMNAGKSTSVLTTHYNYQDQNKKALLFTSVLDDRYGLKLKNKTYHYTSEKHSVFDIIEKHEVGDIIDLDGNIFAIGLVQSRIGLSHKAIAYYHNTNIYQIALHNKSECVIVDEAQFLTEEQVFQLSDIVHNNETNTPVICYGLKIDFRGKLFEGSEALLATAEKIEELKTVCVYCPKKATRNMRVVNGKPSFYGEQIVIGDKVSDNSEIGYISVCKKCENEMKKTGKLKNKYQNK